MPVRLAGFFPENSPENLQSLKTKVSNQDKFDIDFLNPGVRAATASLAGLGKGLVQDPIIRTSIEHLFGDTVDDALIAKFDSAMRNTAAGDVGV